MKKQPEVTDTTRKILLSTFWQIYQQKPIDKITIKEIVENAHVHRSTFYRYFSDIYDLLDGVEQQIICEIEMHLKMVNTQDITDIISHADMLVKALKNCAPMICHLTSPRGDVHFRNKLQEQLRAQFSSFEVGHKYSLASEYLFSFMFSCILSNLNFWYEHQEECTLEQICLMSKQLISNGVAGYIDNINCDRV